MIRTLRLLCAVGLLIAAPVTAEQGKTGGFAKVTTPAYRPDMTQFNPPLGVYTYSVSWQGIPAAEAVVAVSKEDGLFKITTTARTLRAIDLFYRLRYRAEGVMDAENLLPIRAVMEQQENSKVKLIEMDFLENGDIQTSRSQRGKDTVQTVVSTDNFTLDPFSAAFMARSMPWREGMSRSFDTFNGKDRYLITLTATARSRMRVNGEKRDVWEITPKITNISKGGSARKLRGATIYVTDDEAREVVKLTSEVFVGSVNVKFDSFAPLPSLPSRLAGDLKLRSLRRAS